jgi:predicted DNA-binding transcriptional regulator AlpA
MSEQKKRGGDMKQSAPPGYYTAKQAMARLGLNSSTFYYYVRNHTIPKKIPPMRKEGFYPKKEIDQLANQVALFFHTSTLEQVPSTEVRVARPEDAQGIYDVLDSFGWRTASVEQRVAWYKVNPFIDYIVFFEGRIAGYITSIPYSPEAMAAMMAGTKRAWDITPAEILPYKESKTYDVYVGIATRQDIPEHFNLARRLIVGFMTFLEDLAQQGIIIRHMYAVSAEKDGQKFCRDLGFSERPNHVGEVYAFDIQKPLIRFVLDLETSQTIFAKRYRKAWRKHQ